LTQGYNAGALFGVCRHRLCMSPSRFHLAFPRWITRHLFVFFLLASASHNGTAQVSKPASASTAPDKPTTAAVSSIGGAEKSANWYLNLSPYTHHWYDRPEHRPVFLAGVERYDPDNSLMGFAVFQNSFGDPSVYIYPWGQSYPNFLGFDKLTAKWSAGLLYGYVGRWEREVPFNHNGFSPGFVPAVSWKLGNGLEAQFSIPSANVMFHLLVPFNPRAN